MTDETCCGACGYPIHATKESACNWCRQSADRIEALTAENERLERVVKDISDEADLAEQEACMVEDDFVKTEKEIDDLNAKLEKAVEGLRAFKDFDDMPTSYKRPDVFELRVRRKLLAALAEIEGSDAP